MRTASSKMTPFYCSGRKNEKPASTVPKLVSILPKSPLSSTEKSPYRYLQSLAVSMNIPGNLKGEDLRKLISAKLSGEEEVIERFKEKHAALKRLRKERKTLEGDSPLDLRKQAYRQTQGHVQKTKIKKCESPLPSEGSSYVECSSRNSSSATSGYSENNGNTGSVWNDSKQNKLNPSHPESSAFSFSPNLLPMSSPFPDYKNFNSPYYPSEFPFSPREWQSQLSSSPQVPSVPMYPLPPLEANTNYAQQPYNMFNAYNAAQSWPVSSMYPRQEYSTQGSGYPSSTFDPYSPAFSTYRSSTADNYSATTTPSMSNLPSVTDCRLHLPKPPPFDDTTQSLPNLDVEMLNDFASLASNVVGGRSFTSSLENNVSWTSINQDMLNFLNSDASFNSASSEMSNKKLESDEADLLGLFPEFQCSENQAFPLPHDTYASNQQSNKPVPMDYSIQSMFPHCESSTSSQINTTTSQKNTATSQMNSTSSQVNTTFVSSSSYYSNTTTPVAPHRGSDFTTPYCELCFQHLWHTCVFCHLPPVIPSERSCPHRPPVNPLENSYPHHPPVNPSENSRSTFSSQIILQEEKDPNKDSLLDELEMEDSGDITLQLSIDSDETDELHSDGELVINEDVQSQDLNETEDKCAEGFEEDDEMVKTYHVLEAPFSNKEIPNLDSHTVESIIKESESSQGACKPPYFGNLSLNIVEAVCSQSFPVDEDVAKYAEVPSVPVLEENSSSSIISVGKREPNTELFVCPVTGCSNSWNSPSQSIHEHIRKSHPEDILNISQLPFNFSVKSLVDECSKAFIMESQEMLFIISITNYKNRIVLTLQHLPKSLDSLDETISSLEGALEVIKSNQAPSSWVGNIQPYYTHFTDLISSNQCLVLDPNELEAVVSVWAHVYFISEKDQETHQKKVKKAKKRKKLQNARLSRAAKVAKKI